MNVLKDIVASKLKEINELYQQYNFVQLKQDLSASVSTAHAPIAFYEKLARYQAANIPFFISEFKRKSPSEGWINQYADLPEQLHRYAHAGAAAISVLTDEPFFGGTYNDLLLARQTLSKLPGERPLLLQKEFILDPIQLYLAKKHGADLILLIAAILPPDKLEELRLLAESLGLGVLVEVHDEEEFEQIKHLDFQVLGVNNRDLKTFRTALNRVNVLAQKPEAKNRFVVAESGVLHYRHFQAVRKAHAFLIGTGLMRNAQQEPDTLSFHDYFRVKSGPLFKACGIRTLEILKKLDQANGPVPDWAGINFSPLSKRQPNQEVLLYLEQLTPSHDLWTILVAVFYHNTPEQIMETLTKYPFRTVQLYANDISPEFVCSLKQRIVLAQAIRQETDFKTIEDFAPFVDFFILDGALPGSGQSSQIAIPPDFPYPFLRAGGISIHNLQLEHDIPNCIGVDIASGIETDGEVDWAKIEAIAKH